MRKHSVVFSRFERGQAMLIVLSFLSVFFIVGVSFFVFASAERASSLRHLDLLRARYIAEAGLCYARTMIENGDQDGQPDTLQELAFQYVDNLSPEQKWFDLSDSQGAVFGRFKLKLSDESGKLNLNTCSKEELSALLSYLGLEDSLADQLLSGRPFDFLEEAFKSLPGKDLSAAGEYLTVYSREAEYNLRGRRRAYLNSSQIEIILQGMLSSGVSFPYEKAVNLKDALDRDLSQTILDKYTSGRIEPAVLQSAGSWYKKDGFYTALSGENGGGVFVWKGLVLPDGEYYCFLYAQQDSGLVGEVNGQLLYSGEGLKDKVFVRGGELALDIIPAKDLACSLASAEFIGGPGQRGLIRQRVTGVEAVVINEIMPKPQLTLWQEPVYLKPGERVNRVFTGIKAGVYYLRVFAGINGGSVGDVSASGVQGEKLLDGDFLPAAVEVYADGKLNVEIANNNLSKSSFKGVIISQQPETEFIELLNLSDQSIDLSDFSVEVCNLQGVLSPGWPARIPQGTSIRPYQHLALVVDNNDALPSPEQLCVNRISFYGVWGFGAVGMIFDDGMGAINRSYDLLPDGGARIVLKDTFGRQVDSVAYAQEQVKEFISLEKGDPGNNRDSDGDGFFGEWFESSAVKGATPGLVNDNPGMYTGSDKHSVAERRIPNQHLRSLSELADLPSGLIWQNLSVLDIARVSDNFALSATELPFTGNYQGGDFRLAPEGVFESYNMGESGIWRFSGLSYGSYFMSIISEDDLLSEGGSAQVSVSTQDDLFSPENLLYFSAGSAAYGRIAIARDNAVLSLKIVNAGGKKIAVKGLLLEPCAYTAGRVNVNTASWEVLSSLLKSKSKADEVVLGRPYGRKDARILGRGDFIAAYPALLGYADGLSVKSDVFSVVSTGQYGLEGKQSLSQSVRAVVERLSP